MAAAMDRNPQITVNARDENIEALLQQIDTTNLDTAMAHLQAKYHTLAKIPAFNSTDADTGYGGITSVDDKGITVDGSERSLATFVQEQITLAQEAKSVNPAEAIQKADQFIRSMALTQRVRDITTETKLDKVLDYLSTTKETLLQYGQDKVQTLKDLTEETAVIANRAIEQINTLNTQIVNLCRAIMDTQKEINRQSRESSKLFTIKEGMNPSTVEANQARGAAMVPGIQALIDGPNGLREKCMEALQFVVHAYPAQVKAIKSTIAPLLPKDEDKDDTLTATAFDTVGMNHELLASLTPAQRVAKLAELTARHSEIMSAIDDFELNLQQLMDTLEQTNATLATTRSTKDTVLTQMDLAGFQNTVKGTPTKSKAKFKTSHDASQLEAQKVELETQETTLAETCDNLKQQIKTLMGLQATAEADLDAVQQEIDALNSAFDDAEAAYHTAQQEYSAIAARLNTQDDYLKADLEKLEANKAALAENLERAKAAATANRDAAKATFIKGQAENIDARLKEMFDLLKSNMEEGSQQFADDPAQHHDVMRKIVEETNPRILQEAIQLSTQRTHDRVEAFAQIEAEYNAFIKDLDEKNAEADQDLDGRIDGLRETKKVILANLEAYKAPVDEAYAALKEIAAIAGKDIGDIVYIVDLADVAAHPAAAAAAAAATEDGANTEEEEEEAEDAPAPAPEDEAEDEADTPATPLTPAQILAAARADYNKKAAKAVASRDAAAEAPDNAELKAQNILDTDAASEAGKLVAALEATQLLSDTFAPHDGASAAEHQEESHVVDFAGNSNSLGDDF